MRSVLTDALWGPVDLSEPVQAELVRSAPVQRLRGINQAGAGFYLFPEQRRCTRFEHSVGVMALLTLLGAPLEERVAGLLHDVPHTAFSHTVDAVFPNDEHNYHERFHEAVITRSEIPAILRRHGLTLRAALEPALYPHLEQPLPDLCADRVDYALRDALALGKVTPAQAREFIAHVVPGSAPLALDSPESARHFAHLFEELNDDLWANPNDAGAYWALAGAIRRALANGDMSEAHLFLNDAQAMAVVQASADPIVHAYLRLLTPGTRFYQADGHGPSFHASMKNRSVDPLVLSPGMSAPTRLSAFSPEFAAHLAARPGGKAITYRLWSDSIDPLLAAEVSRT